MTEPRSTSPSITARRSAPAEVLDLELGGRHVELARVQPLGHFDLLGGEFLGALVLERAHRDHRQARIDLDRSDGIARIAAEERLLERGVGNRFAGTGKAGAELHPGRAHFQIGGDRFARPMPPATNTR
jgi:hypothetical protein